MKIVHMIATLALVALLATACASGEQGTTQPPPAPAQSATQPAPSQVTEEPTPESDCKPLKKSQLSEIAPGMERSARVKSGAWVPLNDEYRFGFNQVFALRLSTGEVATFAAESLGKSDQGLLMAVNGSARKHFTWGAAVRPGSPMDDDLQAVKDSLEYTEAIGCARG
jgi:hypothetical protein